MKKRLLLSFLFLLPAVVFYASPLEELKRIKTNYKNYLVPTGDENASLVGLLTRIPPEQEMSDQMVVELHQRYPFNIEKIENYMDAQQADGSWSDINYADTKRSGWEPKSHAERVLELAKLYYSPQTPYYQSGKVLSVIRRALDYWFVTKPVCLNWWYNQIGVPKTFGMAFILLEEQLSEAEKKEAVAVMENAKFGMTGQNRVWLAANVLTRALLQNDPALVREARDIIVSEIVTGQPEGIKSDWCFHQHGPQQQFGNYGLSYISGMSFFSGLFAGTSLAMDGEQLSVLASLINEGYRWIIWRGYMDINALNRQLFHNAPVHKAFALAFAANELAKNDYPACREAAGNILSDNFPPSPLSSSSPSGASFTGHKHFWDSDQTIHRRPAWMASVRMASDRVIGTELMNEDNLKGYYMGDGGTYVYTRGDEYLNVFPFWDWRKVPGITSYESDGAVPRLRKYDPRNKSGFVGGVTDGNTGLTAMELNRDGLTARKAWVFTDDFMFCLGTDIRSDSGLVVTTSVEQRLKRGDLFHLNRGKWQTANPRKGYNGSDQRFFHDGTGYILPENSRSIAVAERRTGRWHDFMGMYTPAEVEGEVMSLHIDHGVDPDGACYRYFVIPATTKEAVHRFDASSLQVLRNDKVAQVVSLPAEKTSWIIVYQPLIINLHSDVKFETEAPGLYIVRGEGDGCKVYYADPTHTRTDVAVTVAGKAMKADLSLYIRGKTALLE